MSDAPTLDKATKPKASTNQTSPGPAFDFPKFEIPKFGIPKFEFPNIEMPAAIRQLAEKGGAQVKDNYEKIRSASEDMTGTIEATFATAAKGATEYSLKVIEVTRANATAAFDFVGKLMNVKSPSEVVELSTAHARQQFDAASRQNKELLALAQKVAADVVEPIKTGMSKAFER